MKINKNFCFYLNILYCKTIINEFTNVYYVLSNFHHLSSSIPYKKFIPICENIVNAIAKFDLGTTSTTAPGISASATDNTDNKSIFLLQYVVQWMEDCMAEEMNDDYDNTDDNICNTTDAMSIPLEQMFTNGDCSTWWKPFFLLNNLSLNKRYWLGKTINILLKKNNFFTNMIPSCR
jgi:hypothetical protein